MNSVAISFGFSTKQVNVACYSNNGLRGELLGFVPCSFSNGLGANIKGCRIPVPSKKNRDVKMVYKSNTLCFVGRIRAEILPLTIPGISHYPRVMPSNQSVTSLLEVDQ